MSFVTVSFVLTSILVVAAGLLAFALSSLTRAVHNAAKELQDLAAETSRHEQAVSKCVTHLQRCISTPTRKRA